MRIALVTALCFAAVSCRASQPPAVTHVVICWLKSPGDEAARRRIIDETDTLRQIPGVVSVTAGRAIPSTRPVVDSSYDVGIVITFKDEAALRAYEANPIHIKAREQVLKPLAGKIVIYDIQSGGRSGEAARERTAQKEAGATMMTPASATLPAEPAYRTDSRLLTKP